MKIDYELTEKDFEILAEKIIQKQTDALFMQKIIETSEKVAENKYWHVFDKNHSAIEIHHLLEKHLSGLIKRAMFEENMLQQKVNSVLNIDSIKKLGAKSLRDIAYQLEKEAETLED
jgi:hypothetical protein